MALDQLRTDFDLEGLPLGICIFDNGPELSVASANTEFMRLIGRKGQNSGDTTLHDLLGRAAARKILSAAEKSLPETLTLKITGKPIYIRARITHAAKGGKNKLALWCLDAGFGARENQELRQAVAEADATAQMKANFLATMSHELRTPMQAVYGFLELIGEEDSMPRIWEMVSIAKDSAGTMLYILDDILDLAKMDADKLELDPYEVPLRTLASSIIEAIGVQVHGTDVKLGYHVDDDVPAVAMGDPKRLRQILMNLVGNAVKFTHQGHVELRLSRGRTITAPENGLALRFEVRDTGIGMNSEAIQKLFSPFSQADTSTTRKFGGTGLGLSICKKLVEKMGGQIGVESTPGEGSLFWIEIPTEAVSAEKMRADMPKLDGVKILFVEDHPQAAKEIHSTLTSIGANALHAENIETGREALKKEAFDVLISDQSLPDGLGTELLREAAHTHPGMGLIMYTARQDKGLEYELKHLGALYLTKPASRLGLGEAVESASRKSRRFATQRPRKVLVAEDTSSVRAVLERQLDKLGMAYDMVEDGAAALEAWRTDEYGFVITDLHMPEMDGYGVIEGIRQSEYESSDDSGQSQDQQLHTPVAVITADVQMLQRQTYLEIGFDECLLKPVSLGQLKQTLSRWGLLESQTEDENAGASEDDSGDDDSGDVGESGGGSARRKKRGQYSSKNHELKMENVGYLEHEWVPGESAFEYDDEETNEKEHPICQETMRAQLGSLDHNAVEMLGMFISMTEPTIQEIRQAEHQQDVKALIEVAHSLKGSARSAAAPLLGDLAEELQRRAENSEIPPDLIRQVEAEFERVRQHVKTIEFPTPKPG